MALTQRIDLGTFLPWIQGALIFEKSGRRFYWVPKFKVWTKNEIETLKPARDTCARACMQNTQVTQELSSEIYTKG